MLKHKCTLKEKHDIILYIIEKELVYMKNRNGGFIATSLIYSFFLVFIAVIMALVSNYVANKTIMNRFNEDVMEELNTKSYTVTVYGKNTNIQNGMTLTNLLTDGTFPNLTYWGTSGSCSYSSGVISEVSSSSLVMSSCSSSSYASQKVYVLNGSTYYYTVSHYNPNTTVSMTFGNSITLSKTSEWIRTSNTYVATSTNNIEYIVGKNIVSYNTVKFSNAMVLNLTASFGAGYEPDKSWIDKNIDYFDGTISFIRLEGISSKESLTIRFNLYSGYTDDSNVKCYKDGTNTEVALDKTSSILYDANNRPYKEITIKSVESNIRCDANWR